MTVVSRALLCLLPALLLAGCQSAGAPPPQPVGIVDLHRYQGLWYEVASIPNRFQKHCAGDTTAAYRLRPDGQVDVTNRCRTRLGDWDEARGVARVVDPASNARLEVSFVELFGWRLFWGDYWILELAPDYSHVIVGTPGRNYGWILARSPTLSATTRRELDRHLRQQGYDPQQFVDTEHRP